MSKRSDDVIDLTEERPKDPSPPRKIRRSEKKEKARQQFQAYLGTLNAGDRQTVENAFLAVQEEKSDIMQRREQFAGTAFDALSAKGRERQMLDAALVALDNLETLLRSRQAPLKVVRGIGAKARGYGSTLRERIHNLRSEASVSRLQNRLQSDGRRTLLEDPTYVAARSQSMVSPFGGAGMYAPDVTPAGANEAMLSAAMGSAATPGLLPDGTWIPPRYVREHGRTTAQGLSTAENTAEAAQTYMRTNFIAENEQERENFEHLVDLALNEAEPLPFPPELLCNDLEHQRLGLGWLVRAERGKHRGAILADDMGLGKTVQTIALFYANPPAQARRSFFNQSSSGGDEYRLVLIVCPVALIATWADELESRVRPEHRLRVYVHHRGLNKDLRESAAAIAQAADVVICSYQAVAMEETALRRYRSAAARAATDGVEFRGAKPLTPLHEIKWHRVVLDEAHIIKNRSAVASTAVAALTARHRLALTGTPMQNRLDELFPIVRFLDIKPYREWAAFAKLLPPKNMDEHRRQAFKAQEAFAAFLSAVLLRRMKHTVINGRRIIDNLPAKHLVVEEVPMDGGELESYVALEKSIHKEFKQGPGPDISMPGILVHLLRLRQQACHPLLISVTDKSASRTSWGKNAWTRQAVEHALSALRHYPGAAYKVHVANDDRVCRACEGPAAVMADSYVMPACGHVYCSECSEAPLQDPDSVECVCGVASRHVVNLEVLHVAVASGEGDAARLAARLVELQRPRAERQKRDEAQRTAELARLKNAARRSTMERRLAAEEEAEASEEEAFTDEEEIEIVGETVRPEVESTDSEEEMFVETLERFERDGEVSGKRLPTASAEHLPEASGHEESAPEEPDAEHEENSQPHSMPQSGSTPEEHPVEGGKRPPQEVVDLQDDVIELDVEETVKDEDVKAEKVELKDVKEKEEKVEVRENLEEKKEEEKLPVAAASAASSTEAAGAASVAAAADPLAHQIPIDDIARLFKVRHIFDAGWESSAKIESCLDVLRRIWRESPDDKVIIFSTFTGLLDLMTIPLEAAGVPFELYTGKMNVPERNKVIKSFRTGLCRVLLISLKAGNVGLTLTEANRVIIMEPFWNPYVEDQAQDRVYRIGQSRDVTIYRLRIADSVEQRIVAIQERKRMTVEGALDNSSKTRSQNMSRNDLMFALGVRRKPGPVSLLPEGPAQSSSVVDLD